MVQASTWAHHQGSRTGKDIAGMGGKELMTGSLPALCVCWNHLSLKDLTQSPLEQKVTAKHPLRREEYNLSLLSLTIPLNERVVEFAE